MKIAFLIKAHANPDQLSRFIDRIYGYGDIFVHIDAKFQLDPFVKKIGGQANFISKRRRMSWGSSTQLDAYFEMIKESLPGEYDYYSLHSGSDYPCRPVSDFLHFLDNHNGEEFVSCSIMPDDFRFRYRKISFRRFYNTVDKSTIHDKFLNHIENKINSRLPERKEYKGWTPYLGADWCTITHSFAKSSLKYWTSNVSLRLYSMFSMLPEEWFMQTYGQACGYGGKFSKHGDLRYIDWSTNAAHPANLTKKDFPKIIESKAFFARKMTNESAALLNMLDQHIGYKC